ncbi:Rhomboid-like protein [Tolypocladium capitatum]|uniref:Rhomboid-like protein n=1 Tax=Tolypocladium capitatum TaxID=45235 RepID=A0A2K3QMY0_9HYPO|nr:Rhomboid-like protein [Tolypocladium capitatum]
MGVFTCPNASRALLRAATRGLASAGSKSPASIPSRWLSNSTCRARSITASCQSTWKKSRTRSCPAYSPGRGHGDRRTIFSWPKVFRNYEELPRDYRDQTGLGFSGRDLTEAEARQILGSGISAEEANHLLRILHGRRVAGTLEDPAFAIHTAQFSAGQMAAGLAYLRKTVPVEEVMNAGLRAEDELSQLEQDMEQTMERKQQQTQQQKAAGAKETEETAAEAYKPDPVYGRSQFDEMRARNIAKAKAKEKALEEERRAAEAREGAATAGPVAKLQEQERQISNAKIAEYYDKAQSDLEAPPAMRAWERILPSATVVLLVVGFMGAVSTVYEEPTPRYRLLRELSTSQATVGAIMALNALVLVGWRVPPLWSAFNRYMMVVVATVKPVTLFSAVFSHTKLSHLLVNMVPLWFVGTALHDETGRAGFLTLYLGCGAAGFLGSLTTYTLRGWLTVTSLGASGATLGLCSAYFWEHRTDGFRILGLPQDGVHGIVFLALLTALQLAGLGRTAKLKVDIASHLTGIAAGIVGIELLNRARGGRLAGASGETACE